MNSARKLVVEHDINIDTAVYAFLKSTEERIVKDLQSEADQNNQSINNDMLTNTLFQEREKIEQRAISNATKHEMLCLINIIEERLKARFA